MIDLFLGAGKKVWQATGRDHLRGAGKMIDADIGSTYTRSTGHHFPAVGNGLFGAATEKGVRNPHPLFTVNRKKPAGGLRLSQTRAHSERQYVAVSTLTGGRLPSPALACLLI
jgi:hypothetical protein